MTSETCAPKSRYALGERIDCKSGLTGVGALPHRLSKHYDLVPRAAQVKLYSNLYGSFIKTFLIAVCREIRIKGCR